MSMYLNQLIHHYATKVKRGCCGAASSFYLQSFFTVLAFIHQFVVFISHAIAVELKTHITHTIFHNLSPGIFVFVVQRQYVIFKNVIHLIKVILVLLQHMHVLVICFGYYKTVMSL